MLSALPIVSLANCCCIWIIGGGVLAAYLDQQSAPRTLPPSRGAAVGALAGVVGAIVWLMTSSVIDAVLAPIQERLITEVLRTASDMPPEARAWLESMVGQERSALTYVFGFGLMLFIGTAFAALGGLIGGIYFRKDVPPALGGPPLPPPIPPYTPPPSAPTPPPPAPPSQ